MRGISSGRSAAAALSAAVIGLAGPAPAETLSEALVTAYLTNPTLLSARASLRALDQSVAIARAGKRPDVSASARADAIGDSSDLRDSGIDTSLGLDASQTLYDGGRTKNSVRANIAAVEAARARLIAAEQSVFFDVIAAYVDIGRFQEFVDLSRSNVRVLSEELEAAEDRFEVGEVTRTDVSQARARVAEAQAGLTSAEGDLERARQAFAEVVGERPGDLAPPPPAPPLPENLERAVDIAYENNPTLGAERFDEISAVRDVKTAIGGLLPTVALAGSVDFTESGGGSFFDTDSERTVARLGVVASIPLYQGGAQYAAVRQAQETASAERAEIHEAARDVRELAENAWTELLVSRANVRATREQVEAQRLAFEGVQEENLVGARTTLDVLDAEQELLDARFDLVDAQSDEYLAVYALLSALGRLTADGLDLEVERYDPQVNYELDNDRLFGFDEDETTEWEALWRP